ncbi:uncharacterized protein CXQ87_004320 [Candidozyma duobushaemuli]|uniref:Uncharacterized protein n=1 Tax=Candidozyma duobushaemuli TaxID=1231522 RepID=A0A2V1AEK7_9ASCO|nr:uncharacterized protein CXQ87_004320 [[Candida] duobushaemulonis]PVH16767.1 hypothetical protein CXQ87_004320 [[Candida] duobushaemulonis]
MSRTTKRVRGRMQPMEHGHPPASVLKSDSLQLHDEADLINFRADAFSRFISNQDLLETAASKPFHTSKIAPPSPFPVHKKKLYEEDATDDKVKEVLRDLGKEDFIFGDIRLMKLKGQMIEEELEEDRKALAEMKEDPDKSFSEEMTFQKKAAAQLAKLHRECNDAESLEKLEKAMENTLAEYEEKYSKNYKLQQTAFIKRSIPAEELGATVEKAPENYNPRSISSFLDIEDKPEEKQPDFQDPMFGGHQNDNNGQLYMQGNGDEDFAMAMMNEHGSESHPEKPDIPAPQSLQPNKQDNNENDVNMEDLNQFLADPQGNDDMMGDDMDALMNFGPDNEEGGIMDDDAFNSDFLMLPDLAECGDSGCLPAQFEKTVIVVIDALRFDFVIPVDDADADPYFHNNLPILYDLMQKQPDNAVLLKFLADPPTTTLQRLKGLTTGTLPTFIDAGSNFNGEAIDEDNWVLQLHKQNKSIAFMGDDTWDGLFKAYINPDLHFPYDSFDVGDLHTVDNGVIEHMYPLLERSRSKEWDLLIGHFLGLDHVGHRFGPRHHAMKDKLHQMNSVIEDVVNKIDDKTLLIVMGDHGMDSTGNHGGDSPEELESTLFFYSKNRKFHINKHDACEYDLSNRGRNYKAVNQIDLVPSISLLMGLPVPYNNLGFPIDEVFGDDKELNLASHITVEQINRFREVSNEFGSEVKFAEKYQFISENYRKHGKNKKHFSDLIQESKAFQEEFLDHCKGLWARFDLVLIGLGITVMLLSLSFAITYSRSIPSVRVSTMSFEFIGSIIAMTLLGLVSSISIFIVLRPSGVTLQQEQYCVSTFETHWWTIVLLHVCSYLLPTVIKSFYTLTSSYHSAAPLWIGTGMKFLMFMNASYWTIEYVENNDYLGNIAKSFIDLGLTESLKLGIARIVLFIALILANFSWSRGPLCVKIEMSNAPENDSIEMSSDSDDEGETLSPRPRQPKQPSATILGYENVYGSSYFLLIINATCAILLVTQPIGAISLCIMVVQLLSLLELYDILNLQRNLVAVIVFALLGYQHFFSTGHQAAIRSIQWETGFMVNQKVSYILSGLTIILNTFGSFFIICLAVPLITLWRIPPSAKPITLLAQVVTNVTTLLTYQTIISIMSFIFAAHFRRHLMVWKIFAPRFMLSALLLIVFNVSLTFGTMWFATSRVLTQVNRIFGK